MKLLKKLLPIASVAGVAAVVTPLVTSCGAGTVTLDGTSIYIPKANKAKADDAHKTTGYTNDEALDLYLANVKNDKNVFIDDMLFNISMELYSAKIDVDYEYWENLEMSVKIGYSDITVNTEKDTMDLSASGSIKANLQLETNNASKLITTSLVDLSNFSIKAKNIKYEAEHVSSEYSYINNWRISPTTVEDSVLEATATGSTIWEGNVVVFNGDKIVIDKNATTPNAEQEVIYLLSIYLGTVYHSYHLQDIKSA